MSVLGESERLDRWYAGTRAARGTIERAVFGDGYGTALFLGSVCFFMLYWRIGVFITDNNAIATTLLNVADGRLHLTAAPYGSGLESPGTYVSGDRVYGRNYGVVFAALPGELRVVLRVLEGVPAGSLAREVVTEGGVLVRVVHPHGGPGRRLLHRQWVGRCGI